MSLSVKKLRTGEAWIRNDVKHSNGRHHYTRIAPVRLNIVNFIIDPALERDITM